MDLSRLPLAELQQLLARLPDEIERRRAHERQQVFEELAALARARGFALEDLLKRPEFHVPEPSTTSMAPRRTAPIKYRHPLQRDLTWAGRGKRPRWINA